jgi:hypothetical protein
MNKMSIPIPTSLAYLQQFLTHNKARGMVAEMALRSELGIDTNPAQQKLLAGGWLLSPKIENPQYQRYIVSVLPHLYLSESEMFEAVATLENNRGWQALATFMNLSGIGIIVSGAINRTNLPNYDALTWRNFVYQKERLMAAEGNNPFLQWPGNRGRASKGSTWQNDVVDRFYQVSTADLTSLVLRQAFYYGYLKNEMKKPFEDPYDIDAFVVSYSGAVLPVEIKEKSPTPDGDFGIDAGRILMLLRLCLATDSNALYLIREVENSGTRNLVNWRYITLSDMIIGCKWNLQGGGTGMGGGATQTVMISGALFGTFSRANLSEEWLAQNQSLRQAVKLRASELARNLGQYLPLR